MERLLAAAGPRRHLLESADHWSLLDLQDVAKGAFSELPQWLRSAQHRCSQLATSALLAAASK